MTNQTQSQLEREALDRVLYPYGIRTLKQAQDDIARSRAIRDRKLVGMHIKASPPQEPVMNSKGTNVIHLEDGWFK